MKSHGLSYTDEMIRALLDGSKSETRRPVAFDNSITSPRLSRKEWNTIEWAFARHTQRSRWLVPFGGRIVGIVPRVQPGHTAWAREAWRVGAWRDAELDFLVNNGGRGDRALKPNRMALDYRASPEIKNTPWVYPPDDQWTKLTSQSLEDCQKALELTPDRCWSDEGRYCWEAGDSPCRWRPSIHMPRWAARPELDRTVAETKAQWAQDITPAEAQSEGVVTHSCGGCSIDQRQLFRWAWDSCYGTRPGLSWAENPPLWAYRMEVE